MSSEMESRCQILPYIKKIFIVQTSSFVREMDSPHRSEDAFGKSVVTDDKAYIVHDNYLLISRLMTYNDVFVS